MWATLERLSERDTNARTTAAMSPFQWRIVMSIGLGAFAAVVSWLYWTSAPQPYPSDFSIAWAGARELRNGGNPYEIVGPGRSWDYPYPLLYPLPAVLVALPFSFFPIRVADPLFVGVAAVLFVWAVTQRSVWTPALLAFASIAYVTVAQVSQWSPLICAAALLPSWGPLLACKPTIGAALWVAYPSRRSLVTAAGVTAMTVLVWPSWVGDWLATLPAAPHVVAPVTYWGGPLLLLALLRWRNAEARLLAALACVPQTPILYEAVPLFLIAKSLPQGLLLVGLTLAVLILRDALGPYASYEDGLRMTGNLMVWLLYLPCLWMVLNRPNSSRHPIPASDQHA